MWTLGATVLTEAVKVISNHMQNNAPAPNPTPSYPTYSAREFPTEPSPTRKYQKTSNRNHQHQQKQRRPYRSCSNCSNHLDTQRNRPPARPHTDKSKKGSVCIINVPETGNFEVTVKKTQGDFAKLSIDNQSRAKNRPKTQNNIAKPSVVKKTPEKTWMYLGRIKLGTTEDVLRNYLTIQFPRNRFTIEQLPLYRDGKLPCFKVLVDNAILDEFQDENLWPTGAKITKFNSHFKNN